MKKLVTYILITISFLMLSCKEKRTQCDEIIGNWKAGDGAIIVITKEKNYYRISGGGGSRSTGTMSWQYTGNEPCEQYTYDETKNAIKSKENSDGDWFYRQK